MAKRVDPLEAPYEFVQIKNTSSDFRLLEIKKYDPPYGLIQCALHLQRVADDTVYIACIEPDHNPLPMDHAILCDGILRVVPATTYEILTKLHAAGWQWLWIPSLCVDLSSTIEQRNYLALKPQILDAARKWAEITLSFQYTPLKSEHDCRLLELHVNPGADISATLRDASLDDIRDSDRFDYLSIQKELVSKSWPMKTTLLCNGMSMRISSQLYLALQSLAEQGLQRLWVEAICVNLNDPSDLAHHDLIHNRIESAAARRASVRPPEFVYTALPSPTSIRLLRIQPTQDTSQVLLADIFWVELSEAPTYTALSYDWGPAAKDHVVFTPRGAAFLVTANLFYALHDLRKHGYEHVWADAICIDQQNSTEKGQQVLLMRKIYRRASRVVVELGMDNQFRGGVDYAGILTKMLARTYQVLKAVRKDNPRLMPEELSKFGLPPPHHTAWRMWNIMRARSWFTRSWIIQEVVAGVSVDVLFNWRMYRWEQLEDANMVMQVEYLKPGAFVGRVTLYRIASLRGAEEFPTLLELASIFRNAKSSDARDKIYAFQGLARDHENAPPPDYSRSIEETYRDFAKYCIGNGLGTQLLCEAGKMWSRNTLGTPSWVPDWGYCEEVALKNFHGAKIWTPVSWKAPVNDDVTTNVRTTVDQNVIAIRGAVIDQIESMTECFLFTGSTAASATHSLVSSSADQSLSQQHAVLNIVHSAKEMMAKNNTVLERYSIGPTELALAALLNGDYRDNAVRLFEELQTLNQRASNDRKVLLAARVPMRLREFDSAIRENMINRRFCITRSGCVGLVPIYSMIDDRIMTVHGAPAPFVIHPGTSATTQQYRLIGDAYIHGMTGCDGGKDLHFEEILVE